MEGNGCCQSVLNELLNSKKSELIRIIAPNRPMKNNIYKSLQASAAYRLLNSCKYTLFNAQISVLDKNIFCRRSWGRTQRQHCSMVIVILLTFYLICSTQSQLAEDHNVTILDEEALRSLTTYNNTIAQINGQSILKNSTGYDISAGNVNGKSAPSVPSNGYLDKLDNLERSVAAVLIKVAYGTTSTTKRSIPDNGYILGLTTVATPLLTTLRYQSAHQPKNIGGRYRNYELDLERDHALPTSAPNADILKSNNNPTYPNPNRHHSDHDRDRHRHIMQYNSTPMPSIPNFYKKSSGQPTLPMYPGDIPSYSPPSRSFFTPPLPPEYQNPFADKPTLRGTNNDGLITNIVTFNNRRPIPPPSLMPGHERIPFRPPDLAASVGISDSNTNSNESYLSFDDAKKTIITTNTQDVFDYAGDRKKTLNTVSWTRNDSNNGTDVSNLNKNIVSDHKVIDLNTENIIESNTKRQEVLPNIRRILGSNGKKGDIPAVLLRQVTQRPIISYHQPPAPSISSVGNVKAAKDTSIKSDDNASVSGASQNINKSKQFDIHEATKVASVGNKAAVTTPSGAAAIGDTATTLFTTSSTSTNAIPTPASDGLEKVSSGSTDSSGTTDAAAASALITWTWAWNIHVYLSVVLFTILSVYSFYKLITYNKLTHLFAQSYFVYIHIILIAICIMRIFYLCCDAYNINGTFHIFAAEILLNLPATFLTVAFSVLILFLFIKSLNHKNNRYSALVRPLTVIVGCGVHVGLCITLHYVESYTLQNHQMHYQQQQFFRRQHQQLQVQQQQIVSVSPLNSLANPPPPPRVLSLICQIIYIFICLSLGLLYLYLYRILKRILRSKSQNYIHGYQNLTYAIHITIATALLFVLLAALQIFGAVCISTSRPLMSQANIVEVDWLQWGYQFSFRLIEIAIITLISCVAGLKMGIGSGASAPAVNGDARMIGPAAGIGVFGTSNSGGAGGSTIREKHASSQHTSNVANFFLPCTSSSSQEHFDTDYPAICNANTNLHTYTMRTGKLIYDDSYAFNSAGSATSPGVMGSRGTEYQLQEPMYQRPYDTGSIRSTANHNFSEFSTAQLTHRYQSHHAHVNEPATYISANYIIEGSTDHYENPNFDLRVNSTGAVAEIGAAVECMQKFSKNTVSSGSASVSGSGCGSGSSGTSQQQMLLLQSDSCYSESLQENLSYEFNNFERPIYKEKSIGNSHPIVNCWTEGEREVEQDTQKITKYPDKKLDSSTAEREAFENPELRSSISTNSYSSSNGARYISYNSYEFGSNHNGVRKSGTLNNIANVSTTGTGPSRTLNPVSGNKRGVHVAQTLVLSERSHYYKRNGRTPNTINRSLPSNDLELTTKVRNDLTLKQAHKQKQQQKYEHNSEEEEEDDEDMLSESNVECTNLISISEHGACPTSDKNTLAVNKSQSTHLQKNLQNMTNVIQHMKYNQNELSCMQDSSKLSPASTGSGLDKFNIGEQDFLRYRNSEVTNINDTNELETANHSTNNVPHQSRCISAALSQIGNNASGIDC